MVGKGATRPVRPRLVTSSETRGSCTKTERCRSPGKSIAAGKLAAQAKSIDRGGDRCRDQTRRLADQDDLLHVGTAPGAGPKVQRDTQLCEDRQPVIQIFRSANSDIAARDTARDPLRGMVFHTGRLSSKPRGVTPVSPH